MLRCYLMDKLASLADERVAKRRRELEELNKHMANDSYASKVKTAVERKAQLDEAAQDALAEYYANPSDRTYSAGSKAMKAAIAQRKAMMNNTVSMNQLRFNTAAGAGLGGLAGAGLGYWLNGYKGAVLGGLSGAGLGGVAGYHYNNIKAGLGGDNLMYPHYEYGI